MDRDIDAKSELVETLSSEMTTIKRKLTEIKAQIDQTQIMVDREQQRNSDIATDIENIKNNLDTVPREDIRDKYNEALDARFRLATMRGQLEKFQSHATQLEGQQTILGQILGRLQGVSSLDADLDEDSNGVGPSSLNVVRIVQAQEEERQRLARQMHDGPAQSLTNFILQAEICQRLFDRNPDRAAEELSNLKTAASVTFQKVRDFIFDLRPMMLDDLGVVPTVRRYVDSFREKNDIATEFEFIGEERRLESHREVMVFRTIQELMGHARDYATASQLKIKLDMASSTVRIAVQDNGRAFDAEAIFSSEDTHLDGRGQGLLTMKEKFDLVSGSISVLSSENDGTLVRVELPAGQ
ncbi:MAG: sensor histidine kinase [bacterium]|nr:sensor histidine kinase [bacterium]